MSKPSFDLNFNISLDKIFLKVPLTEKIIFAKHLSIVIKAGMPIVESLKLIQKQTTSKNLKRIIGEVITDVSNGRFLSESLGVYQEVFGDLFINIIRIGETSGTLWENLEYLAAELKKKMELERKVRGALIYPAVILVITIAVVLVLALFIFPKIMPIFKSMKVSLPWTTQLMMGSMNFIGKYWMWLILGFIIFAITSWLLLRIKEIRFIADRLILYVPVIGPMNKNINMVNFTRGIGILLKSGVQIVDAIEISADTFSNLVYKKELKAAAAMIRKGEQLSKYLASREHLFPSMATSMIEVGENTGNLVENLFYLSEYYESELDETVKNLSTTLEPFLLVFMGLMVGFIAVSIIAPIYSITQTMTK